MKRRAEAARAIYDAIDENDGFYNTCIGPHKQHERLSASRTGSSTRVSSARTRGHGSLNEDPVRNREMAACPYTGTTVAQAEALTRLRAFAKQTATAALVYTAYSTFGMLDTGWTEGKPRSAE